MLTSLILTTLFQTLSSVSVNFSPRIILDVGLSVVLDPIPILSYVALADALTLALALAPASTGRMLRTL